ncbi:AraC family transcriptional regulator [Pedobacter sp. V48]|uniref:helix-turn-helix domain-containing protein n=1 Tax=Pedobacter sp. V48 TaxID=509635 RepID=UPI0003E4F639|nr:helix-turn-helix transcriptional regulator [Pedobacter sp. V48]ETZ20991.1 hypothetical protein N824_02440 [Pedobacter sp. V48]
MQKLIPVLDSCSLSDRKEDKLLVDHFAEYLKKHNSLVFPHRHNFYHLVLFTSGGGKHTIDFNQFEVKPWQMYFMTPGQVHTWAFDDDVDGYVMNFSKDFFQSLLLRTDFLDSFSFFGGQPDEGVIELPEAIRQEALVLFEKLYLKVASGQAIQWDAVRITLLYLLVLVDQNAVIQKKNSIPVYNYTILRNFQNLIEKHYSTVRLPKDYADLLYITPNHLNALCKEYLGMQAGEVIRNRVLLEAKRLLVSQDMSISEIAYELNFNDNSYFTKFFKKLVGVTPEEFKKKIIKVNSDPF